MSGSEGRSYSPAQLNHLLRLLVERGLATPQQITDARGVARQRQMPGRIVTPIDVLIEYGQLEESALAPLEAEVAQQTPAGGPAIQSGTLLVALVGIPVLVVLGVLAFKSSPPPAPPKDTIGPMKDFDPREVGAVAPDTTADESKRDKTLEEFADKQAKKHATVGHTPELAPGQAAYVSDKSKIQNKDVQDYFVPLAVVYPQDWMIRRPAEEGAEVGIYVQIARPLPDNPQGMPQCESVSIGFLAVTGARGVGKVHAMCEGALSTIFGELKKTNATIKQKRSWRGVVAGKYQGYTLDFEGKHPEHADITVWGRIIVIPPGTASQRYGLNITVIGNSLNPDVKTLDDLVEKSASAAVLKTLTLGG